MLPVPTRWFMSPAREYAPGPGLGGALSESSMKSYDVGIEGALGARLGPGAPSSVVVVAAVMTSDALPGGCEDADILASASPRARPGSENPIRALSLR